MQFPIVSSPAQARQTRERFARPEDQLSYELGKAVQELPPVYTRVLAGSISLLVFGTLAWANFSQVDEVAVGNGELIPSTQVRPVRALSEGKILEIKVKEGDRVKKDDVLIQRDPDIPQTDVDRLTKSAKLIREDLGRLEAERIGKSTTGAVLQDQLLISRLKDFEARQAAAVAEADSQFSALNEAKVRLTRLEENLGNAKTSLENTKINLSNAEAIWVKSKSALVNAQKREDGLRILLTEGATPRLDYIEAQSRVIQAQAEVTKAADGITNARDKVTEAQDKVTSLEKELAAQTQKIRQADQEYQAARNKANSLSSARQSEVITELNKRREEQTTVEGQLEQAKKKREGETIQAPVSGTIYSVKATKGPVQSGEELLSIVPDGEEMLLEIKILNRDIGFIRPGLKAKVKMATFPFQEFGTVDGTVVQVSPNAIVDKDLGLVFPTRIKLDKTSMQVRGQTVAFTPGMSATGEVVTRKKSILTFLIEPVTRRFNEAFSVR